MVVSSTEIGIVRYQILPHGNVVVSQVRPSLRARVWPARLAMWPERGVGNETNLVHLVEKSVENKLKPWEIKADFLEIKLWNQPNPPPAPTFTMYYVFFEGNHGEIKEKSGNLVRQNCSLPTPQAWSIFALLQHLSYLNTWFSKAEKLISKRRTCLT